MTDSKVRIAKEHDVDFIVEVGRKFHSEVPWPYEQKFNEEHVREYYKELVNNEAFCFFLTQDNKAGAGVAIAKDLCTGALQAQELFWFVDKDCRGQEHASNLYNALEVWCKVQDVETLAMVTLNGLRSKAVGRVYESKGFHLLEHVYVKQL